MDDVESRRRADAETFVANLEDELRCTAPGRPLSVLDVIEGSDSSNLVHCMVRLDGYPLRIDIMSGWWMSVGADGVANAVLQAHGYACEKAGIAKLLLRRHGRDWSTRSGSRQEPGDPTQSGDHTDMDAVTDILQRLEKTASRVSTAMRRFERRHHPEHREITGPHGLFTLTLRGSFIDGARVDMIRLGPEDASALASDALAALTAARSGTSRNGGS
ncbi:hypothetical protein [Actinoplanes sp. G11-F43]|uniref:hypothetical protein n=1 Tax=Actinoplanes sp. G11-F43 TaxID=3424130 RepID=UPI003D3423E2